MTKKMKNENNEKVAIIIGAGPAGLTAAYELLDKTDIKPVIFEMSETVGGLAKSVDYKGNKIDIGPHRYFSKSEKVVDWWENILPVQGHPSCDDLVLGRDLPLKQETEIKPIKEKNKLKIEAPDPERTDKAMLFRGRLTRIFFLRKFFDYPVSLSFETLRNLGPARIYKILASYIKIRLRPIREEKSLEDFFINRFGSELYNTFFKDYTEKLWGIPANEISASWGAQRVKGVSISKAVKHWLDRAVSNKKDANDKNTETSLIGCFKFPKRGSGQMWSEAAGIIAREGGELHLRHRVIGLDYENGFIRGITVLDEASGSTKKIQGDYFFSTMPISELTVALGGSVPESIREIGAGLLYRDIIVVGLQFTKLELQNTTGIKTLNGLVPDNWLYIQEKEVKMGRMSIKNNLSPYVVNDPNTVLISVEYFCSTADEMWGRSDAELIEYALAELEMIGIAKQENFLDGTVIREKKAYPVYHGTYGRFDEARGYLDNINNLFLIGRNGMHRYNNMDHSMLTAMQAVENIINGVTDKSNIWSINTEEEYHEEHSLNV